jgi:hypothetical protein
MILSPPVFYMNRVFFVIDYLNLNKMNYDYQFRFVIPILSQKLILLLFKNNLSLEYVIKNLS